MCRLNVLLIYFLKNYVFGKTAVYDFTKDYSSIQFYTLSLNNI